MQTSSSNKDLQAKNKRLQQEDSGIVEKTFSRIIKYV